MNRFGPLLLLLLLTPRPIPAQGFPTVRFVQTQVPNSVIGVNYSTTFTGTAGTPPYTYSVLTGPMPPGLTLSPSGEVTGIPTATGSYPVTLKITDTLSNFSSANFTFVVSPAGTLTIATPALPTARNSQFYSTQLLASGGRTPYVFTITGGILPAGITLNTNGLLSGTPTADGTSQVTVQLADGNGASVQSLLSLTVVSSILDYAPIALPAGQLNLPYTATLAGIGGISPYSFKLLSGPLPPGIALSTNGNLTGTPTASGIFPLLFRVTDASTAVFQRQTSLEIASSGLTITTASLPPPFIGQPYSLQLTATGGTPPYRYSISNGALPSGLTLSTNGLISGIPTNVGQSSLTFRVEDSTNASATRTLSIMPVESDLRFTFNLLPSALIGQPYSYPASATGGTPPYSYSAVNALPDGLTLSPAGLISGVPSREGTYNVGLRVQDSQGSTVQANFGLSVNGTGFRFTNLTLPVAFINQPYNQSLTTAGGTGTTTYSIASGALPTGITLSPNGALSGTPTATGTAVFSIRATDTTQTAITGNFTLQVTPPSPSLLSVTSAANYNSTAISPGEILTLFGTNLGPATLATFSLVNNTVPTTLSGTTVRFDGIPAPIIYTSATQVAVVAPFAFTSSSARITVEYQGTLSTALTAQVRSSHPAIFTADSSGTGQGAILNQNGSANSPSNPAPKNSVISIYLTGGGQTNPPQVDGLISPTPANLIATTIATVNNQPATINYAGNAPGLIPGVVQINLTLPNGTTTGPNLIKLTIGGVETTSTVTVQVQ